jgi:hypothetical protein
MKWKMERMSAEVTLHRMRFVSNERMKFATAHRFGNDAPESTPRDVRQGIASVCAHVAPALLLC